MIIYGTDKLFENLPISPKTIETENRNPIFAWHANLVMVNRRKTIILMNETTRYLVVLYGLKAKDFKNINTIIINAIKENMEDDLINPEIISQYIPENCQLEYSKKDDKIFTSKLIRSFDLIHYADYDNEKINQLKVARDANHSFTTGPNNEIKYASELFYEALANFYQTKVFDLYAAQININLELENFKVWRRVIVPLAFNFNQLHKIIQTVFNWQDYHLHEFTILDNDKPILNLVMNKEAFDYPGKVEMKLEKDYYINDFLIDYPKIEYFYDFGDSWLHTIEVEKIISNYQFNHATCIEGFGKTPPEDVGGSGGYDNFVRIINDINDVEHEDYLVWSSGKYEDFEIDIINYQLKTRKRIFR